MYRRRLRDEERSSSPRCRAWATISSSRRRQPARRRSTPAQIRALADRRFGVGCDQVLVVERRARATPTSATASSTPTAARSSSAATARAASSCSFATRASRDKREIRVETAGGVIVPRLEDDGEVTVDMGVPRFRAGRRSVHGGERRDRGAARRRRHVGRASPRCRWATRTRCRSSPTSSARRSTTQGPLIEHHRALSEARQRGLHAGRRSR